MIANENKYITHLAQQLHAKEYAAVFSIRWIKRTLGGIYLISHWNSWCHPSLIESPSFTLTGNTNLTEVGLELLNTETKIETCHRVLVEPTDEIEMLLHEDQSAFSKYSLQFAVELRKNGKYLMAWDIFGEPYKLKG